MSCIAILFEYFSSVLAYIILHARPFLGAADSKISSLGNPQTFKNSQKF